MVALILTLLLSAACCGLYLRLARRWQLLDTPNERSSHALPTPHGGGLPLLLAFGVGLVASNFLYSPWPSEFLALACGALFLMVLGVLDDLRGLSVRLRFSLYGLCCLATVLVLLHPIGELPVAVAILLLPCVVLGMLWLLNLYNFMDGIDGIAALQCILACGSAALLSLASGSGFTYPLFCLLLAASHAGFLFWNWPPARLFMGDAGSVPTGFLLAGLALLGAVQGQLNPWCWFVLLAFFITDASCTLAWRMLTGQPFTRPHRLHAYQRLSRHLGSHLAVDMMLVAGNALWLFPLAWAVQLWPQSSFFMVILAYLPLLLGMAKLRHLT